MLMQCVINYHLCSNRRHRCDRVLTWNSGALHYSDEVVLIEELMDMQTRSQDLKNSINTIEYIGKGTYTDCAIKRGLAELLIGYSRDTNASAKPLADG